MCHPKVQQVLCVATTNPPSALQILKCHHFAELACESLLSEEMLN